MSKESKPVSNQGTAIPRVSELAAAVTGNTQSVPVPGEILISGMHRSGTSALARVLGAMGAYIGEPDELLPAHPQDNPSGYWERTELVIAHDRVLSESGYTWDRIAGFDSKRLDTQATSVLTQQIKHVIAGLRAGGRSWLVKDPRLCLLLPLWLAQAPDAACVVMVRDPREIAASLHESHRGVYTSYFLLALWEKYLRTLLMDLRGKSALFVSYSRLLADPESACTRLLRSLHALGVAGLHPVDAMQRAACLDPRLRRSKPSAHVELNATQQSLYDWLDTQGRAEGPVTVEGFPEATTTDAVLDEFEQEFDYREQLGRDRTLNETAPLIHTIESKSAAIAEERSRHERELAAQRAQSAQTERDLETQRQQTAHMQRELDTQRERAAQTLREVDLQRKQTEQVRREVVAERALSERARVEITALGSRLAESQRELELTHNHVRNIEAERNQLRDSMTRLGAHAKALQQGTSALRSSWSWKITAPLRAITSAIDPRTSFGLEQRLYRWYYGFPGLNAARKRAFIVWLHEHAAWLTQHTLSYRILRQSRVLETESTISALPLHGFRRIDAARANVIVAAMRDAPCISIVMPVFNVEARWLNAAVESVRRQFYPHWELCIADDASTDPETRAALDALERSGDRRLKVKRLRKNVGIAEASNAALGLAKGDYIGLLDNDDELARDALLEVAQSIIASQPDIVYSDEDKLDVDGRHVEAHFKPDFNPEYFFSTNYLCHFTALRRSLLKRIGGFRAGFEGAQDFELFLRASEHNERIAHIPKILYHWRKTAGSTATTSSAKPKSWDAGRRALAESLRRRGIDAVAEAGPYPNTYRVRRTIIGEPLVSILIPFRDKPKLLSSCIDSILTKTDYPHFEIVGIDNGSTEDTTHALMHKLSARDSRVRFVRHDVPFNYSAINNFGARQARGEHLLFLNNDTEVIAAEWLRAMLEHSQCPEVGAVGAKLLYPDGRIQHAGVIAGMGGVAGHAHLLQSGDHPGYFARAQLVQNLSAVTFACAMTRRAVFEQIGGLNEVNLTIAFNDIDYCLRLGEAGYRIVYTPFATLFHHESISRGYEDNPEKQARFGREVDYMQQRHCGILQGGDPYFNSNLRLDVNDFSVRPGYIEALPL